MKSKKNIAIFGLGQETKKNIVQLSEKYNIVGLLDSYQEQGELYGFPIVAFDDAVNYGIELIIVIARPGSCRAIARNIGDKCRKVNIELFDIRGNDLLKSEKVKHSFEGFDGYQKKDLLMQLHEAEVVSFDLFDTLIMRRTLYYEDLLEIVGRKVSETGLVIENFAQKRLRAEIELSKFSVPSLRDIYIHMMPGFSVEQIEQLVSIEYECDKSILVPRKEMVELISNLVKEGKKICITTDTYYSEVQIKEIVKSNGIDENVYVLASCENGTTKSQHLFKILKKRFGESCIVHVGDDIKADVESAFEHGIIPFHIYSGRELLDMLGGIGITDNMQGVSDNLKVGMIVAKLFNSPFVFEENGIELKSLEEIGYILYAPMILDFARWIGEMVHCKSEPTVLFSARDGFVLQKIYSLLFPEDFTYYFLTSRIASLRACVNCKADIEYIEETKFSGSDVQKLQIRYGMSEEECKDDIDNAQEGIMRYSSAIIKKAEYKRNYFKKYVENNIIFNKGEVFLVDFSARGTIQMFCERILDIKMKGLYFLQLDPSFAEKYNLLIEPFYVDDGSEDNTIFEDFYIMEPVISSPDPSLDDFDENGCPVYSKEDRSEKEIRVMEVIQEGILEYVSEYHSILHEDPKYVNINKKLDADIFRLIHFVKIAAEDFFILRNIDPFVNRITDLKLEV